MLINTIIIIIIILLSVVVYKMITNNYNKRIALINKGMENIRTKEYTIIEINPSLYLSILKTEGYEIYSSRLSPSLAFFLNGQKIIVLPTAKNHSLAISFSKIGEMNVEILMELVSNN